MDMQLFKFFNDEKMTDPVVDFEIIAITDQTRPRIFRFYFGSPVKTSLLHANGEDILLTFGEQVENLGKLIVGGESILVELKEILNTIPGQYEHSVNINPVVQECYIEGMHHPIRKAVFETNLELYKMCWINKR